MVSRWGVERGIIDRRKEKDMTLFGIRPRELVWVIWPLLVAGFIFVTFNFWVNSGQASMATLLVKKEEVEAAQKEAAQLKSKLQALRRVDAVREGESLKKLTTAMPVSRNVWWLLRELKISASESGAVLEQYKGKVGEVLEASGEAQLVEGGAGGPAAKNTAYLVV